MAELHLNSENFKKEVLEYKDGPVLVDFFATWCGPCKMQGPIVEALAKELEGTTMKAGALDVDQAGDIAQEYGVMSIPTLIIFKDGKAVETMIGLQQKESLKSKLEGLK